MMIKNINIYELRNMMKTGEVLLIDVRENSEYKKRRLKLRLRKERLNIKEYHDWLKEISYE